MELPISDNVWNRCLDRLQSEYSEQEFNTWIRPLQAELNDNSLFLLAPNRFVVDWVKQHFFTHITELIKDISSEKPLDIILEIGSKKTNPNSVKLLGEQQKLSTTAVNNSVDNFLRSGLGSPLNPDFNFNNFVQGKSNEFAFAASSQVAKKPGGSYNPLLIYGDVGLGKTHLMHAVGNEILRKNARSKVLYLHSERFVANMVKALQNNTINDFKRYYRSVDVLLLDDVQFFARKGRSQEELLHTFNTLLEERKQIILTCDRYPKEISGLEERLQSRFGWGLTVATDPPELETRVAILMRKAEQTNAELPYDVAFFIAKRIRSNVRELEGALKRVIANADFTGKPITVDFTKEALRDLITLQDKLVTVENIQKTVAEYYKIKFADMLSKRRNRSITRPRQVAMLLAKELTNRSLPEIGDSFGGRDHTTVLHACRKIKELLELNIDIKEDYSNLLRILTT